MPQIHPAHPTDAQQLARFAEHNFRQTFEPTNSKEDMDLYCAQAFGPDVQRAEIEAPSNTILLCEQGDNIIGFATLHSGTAPDCVHSANAQEIQRLYVDSEWHGQGVAQSLMEAAITSAIDSAADTLWLGVWKENPRAIAFYKKYGFQAVGQQAFYLGTDRQQDIVMSRSLL